MYRLINIALRVTTRIKNIPQHISNQGAYPAGHFYSPIPAKDEVLAYIKSRNLQINEPSDVELNKEKQFNLLSEYVQYYKELPFPEKQTPDCRFYYDNNFYSYSDAIFLYCFLRKHKPKRIVEVGSGFSSAVMLDTVDRFFSHRPEITFIEPYPNRLKSLLRSNDIKTVRIIESKIQDVPYEFLSSLESGDLLFIDSSHVVKCGSDLQFLLFEILPILPAGVFVHFHDVFYPFEYPTKWLKEGKYWNEIYFLRAFLSNNSKWDICFFNTYVADIFCNYIRDNMPLCVKNPGGSLYIQKV